MGGTQSSEKSTDVEAAGQVNNQFVVQHHPVNVQSTEILVILTILCALRVLEVAYGMYMTCKRRIQNRIRETERLRLSQNQRQGPIPTPRPDGNNPA